jgi:hypothetical protein
MFTTEDVCEVSKATGAARLHRFRLRQKPLQEVGGWIARHHAFWMGAVGQLDRLLAEGENDDHK